MSGIKVLANESLRGEMTLELDDIRCVWKIS